MTKILPFVVLIFLMLTACSGSQDFTSQQKQGKRIFESLCDKCHKLIPPQNHNDAEWIQAVNLYGTQLKLQQSEKDAVISYVTLVNDK